MSHLWQNCQTTKENTFNQQIDQLSALNSKGAQQDTSSKGEITSPNHHQSHSWQTKP